MTSSPFHQTFERLSEAQMTYQPIPTRTPAAQGVTERKLKTKEIAGERKARSRNWPPGSDTWPEIASLEKHRESQRGKFHEPADGLESCRNLMATFGDDPIPRLRYNVRIRHGKVKGSVSCWAGYPFPEDVDLPVGTSCEDLCTMWPNHCWGDGLRILMMEDWHARQIWDALPKDAKNYGSENRPWNYLQQALGREADKIWAEAGFGKRKIIPRAEKRKRDSPNTCESEGDHKGAGYSPSSSAEVATAIDDSVMDDVQNGNMQSAQVSPPRRIRSSPARRTQTKGAERDNVLPQPVRTVPQSLAFNIQSARTRDLSGFNPGNDAMSADSAQRLSDQQEPYQWEMRPQSSRIRPYGQVDERPQKTRAIENPTASYLSNRPYSNGAQTKVHPELKLAQDTDKIQDSVPAAAVLDHRMFETPTHMHISPSSDTTTSTATRMAQPSPEHGRIHTGHNIPSQSPEEMLVATPEFNFTSLLNGDEFDFNLMPPGMLLPQGFQMDQVDGEWGFPL